jgi:hypothetical protein
VDPTLGSVWDARSSASLSDPTEGRVRMALVVVRAFLPLLTFLPRAVRRRRFWCAVKRRDVEVEFEECGPPGLRQAVGIRCCSAFEPSTAVTCARPCLDVAFRHQWGWAGSLIPAPRG